MNALLVYLSNFSIFLPILAGIFLYKQNSKLQIRLLFYLILIGVLDFFLHYLSLKKINNLPLFHIFTLFEYLFIAYLFFTSLSNHLYKNIIIIGTIVYFTFNALMLALYSDIFDFNHESRVFESFLLIAYALLYFNHLSKELSTSPDNFLQQPMFWISLGVLLYFSGNFFLFSFYRYIAKVFPMIWTLHSILNILNNIFIAISFLCKPKPTYSS